MIEPLLPPTQFVERCAAVGLQLSPDEMAQLGRYLKQLLDTNQQFNLTAIRDADTAWQRHVLESLSLLPHLEGVGSVVDVGSGGGAPGLPLAIAMPECQITLIEATGKKARFLTDTAEALALTNVTVLADRAETLGQQSAHRERFDTAVARAVGPMRVLLELTLPLVRVGGRMLALKGEAVEEELRDAGDALMTLGGGDVELYEALPGLSDPAVIVDVTKADATPADYPRRPGLPKQEPL